jgi:hypothetical protein
MTLLQKWQLIWKEIIANRVPGWKQWDSTDGLAHNGPEPVKQSGKPEGFPLYFFNA